jgi:hypothetical protein
VFYVHSKSALFRGITLVASTGEKIEELFVKSGVQETESGDLIF